MNRISASRLGWSGWLGLGIVLVVLVLALFGPLLAPHGPAAINPAHSLAAPSVEYLLGTDNLGRCTLSRLLHGARSSFVTAGIAAFAISAIGVSIGAISGYYGGALDGVLMRVVDILLALPSMIVALAIVGTLGTGMANAVLGLVLVWWVGYARIVRGMVLSVRTQPYVLAARMIGANHRRILRLHILPNVIAPVIVLATLELGQLILALAALNFLGLGAQPPAPELGSMLNAGRPFLQTAPQLMIYPGLVIAVVVLGCNLLGDSLRDTLDPYRR